MQNVVTGWALFTIVGLPLLYLGFGLFYIVKEKKPDPGPKSKVEKYVSASIMIGLFAAWLWSGWAFGKLDETWRMYLVDVIKGSCLFIVSLTFVLFARWLFNEGEQGSARPAGPAAPSTESFRSKVAKRTALLTSLYLTCLLSGWTFTHLSVWWKVGFTGTLIFYFVMGVIAAAVVYIRSDRAWRLLLTVDVQKGPIAGGNKSGADEHKKLGWWMDLSGTAEVSHV
ncbi:hypothetical protein HK104_007138 [Borealophlyctis nickersoniae]|nr:hypothetical protein HK104_007138 [Borealophlyctis nickersoniae]